MICCPLRKICRTEGNILQESCRASGTYPKHESLLTSTIRWIQLQKPEMQTTSNSNTHDI